MRTTETTAHTPGVGYRIWCEPHELESREAGWLDDLDGNIRIWPTREAAERYVMDYDSITDELIIHPADPRLIAAAPDLLAACREAYTTLHSILGGVPETQLLALLRQAIAKAEGGGA